ncbi:hypothetical protein ElyMa_001489100 [Elysia marginata]|uniref:Uncharacterized protein n=1 Tax=Elysia marginata TaxID=1093978 RepID=A0AAV4J2X4_9GAST|nr:hypothetical protein ElyMa_001489100 [Elysia marginata]
MLDRIVDKCKEYCMVDQREEDQDDAHWKGNKSAYNNSGKRSARAGLKIFILWTHDHEGCCKGVQIQIEKTRQKFWGNKELLRRNIGLNTEKRILACYVFSVFNYIILLRSMDLFQDRSKEDTDVRNVVLQETSQGLMDRKEKQQRNYTNGRCRRKTVATT